MTRNMMQNKTQKSLRKLKTIKLMIIRGINTNVLLYKAKRVLLLSKKVYLIIQDTDQNKDKIKNNIQKIKN